MAEPGPGARQLAELFHDRYERLAPEFGWMTRMETRTFDPNSTNGRLMIAVCDEILTWLDLRVTADELARLRAIILAARRNGSIPQYPGDVDETTPSLNCPTCGLLYSGRGGQSGKPIRLSCPNGHEWNDPRGGCNS